METYGHLWAVMVENKGDFFTASVWRDTAEGAERFVKAMYPYASYVGADESLQDIGRRAFESIADMVSQLEARVRVSDCCAATTTEVVLVGKGDVPSPECDECGKPCNLTDGKL